MPTLRRRIPTSGYGTPIPVRVEDAVSGRVVALTTAALDGLYSVEVPAGKMLVSERWGRHFAITVPESDGPFEIDDLVFLEGTSESAPDRSNSVPQTGWTPDFSSKSFRAPRTPQDGRAIRQDTLFGQRASATRNNIGNKLREPRDGGRTRPGELL